MAYAIPQLNWARPQIDGSAISGIGDALIGALDRRRLMRQDREEGQILGRWADETYSDNPAAIAGGINSAGQVGHLTPQSLGSRLVGSDPINARIDQAFSAAGQPSRGGMGARLVGGLDLAPPEYRSAYAEAGQRYGVDPAMLARQGRQESGFRSDAVSPAGARGISQFMPQTAERFGIDPSDPIQSIDGQGRYMAAHDKMFGNDGLELAAYNWGEGNVQKWLRSGADPSRMPAETRAYVENISGRPIETWLAERGNGGAGGPTAPQGMTINGVRLPSREVMTAMLRNPGTRPIAAKILTAAHQDRTGELPSDVQEYLFAVRNGFSGDYPSWVQSKTRWSTAEKSNVPSGYQEGPDGTLSFRAGGPADPDVIAEQTRARQSEKPSRPLPQTSINALTEAGSTFEDFRRLTGSFNDEFGGFVSETVGDLANWAGRTLPVTTDERQQGSAWWQDYQTQKNIIRNKLFGSALTATEKAEFDRANINPGMTPQAIRTNLQRQHDATMRAARKLAEVYTRQGYSPDVIEAAIGIPLGELGGMGGGFTTGASPAGMQVEIDGRTYFVGPDGEVYE